MISNGGLGLSISDSLGVSRTGTFKCIGTFAAAEAVMGLALGSGGVTAGSEPVVTLPFNGMVIFSPQDGQSISVPAPD